MEILVSLPGSDKDPVLDELHQSLISVSTHPTFFPQTTNRIFLPPKRLKYLIFQSISAEFAQTLYLLNPPAQLLIVFPIFGEAEVFVRSCQVKEVSTIVSKLARFQNYGIVFQNYGIVLKSANFGTTPTGVSAEVSAGLSSQGSKEARVGYEAHARAFYGVSSAEIYFKCRGVIRDPPYSRASRDP